MLFNLYFAINTFLSCSFYYFYLLTYTFYLLTYISLTYTFPAVIMQMFNPIAELVIPIGIPTKEAKVEMEKHSVIVEVTISE